ncbi:glycoside hydrolase family 16 protein [Nocardioides antri]|uniref:glycoside hydrolase family 16 protein n=1 Tax=Nocardioides antri TaxID=2607659 RepID=UPI00165ED6AA|nr:glycoside hydrolase family 16 protein [Nocardioides antri]
MPASLVVNVRRLVVVVVMISLAGLVPMPAAAPSHDTATVAATAVARDRCGPILRKSNGNRWRCSFVENFKGRKLNRDKWIVQESTKSRFNTGLTCYMDSTRNIKVRRGKLRLITRKGPTKVCGAYKALVTRFTGGMIGTKGHFSQTYGRFEVRAKFPASKESGLQAAFWMYPVEKKYGQWPESGEIDVAEWWSRYPHLVMPSLHYDGRVKKFDSGRQCKVRDVARFHTYRVLWRPDIMRFYIDGRQCFARSWTPNPPQERPQPFDHPFSMILHMGVTQYYRETRITNRTEFPSALVVDYAKAWR